MPLRRTTTPLENSAFRLMVKFHNETECGSRRVGGLHWAECQQIADAFGFDSYETWLADRNARELRSLDAPREAR